MKDKIFGVLQRVGRSFMLPIAILPVAGLLLGIGSSLTNATTIETYGLEGILGDGTLLNALLTIMSQAGMLFLTICPDLCSRSSHRYGEEGKRSGGSRSYDLFLCYAYHHLCSAPVQDRSWRTVPLPPLYCREPSQKSVVFPLCRWEFLEVLSWDWA